MLSLNSKIKLSNNYEIPVLGFGTWQSPNGEITVNAVKTALEFGYRHIDAAAIYGNEKSVGEGIRQSGIKREELFITSKVWNTQRGYEKTKIAFNKSLADLGLDYLDLYLIHWPASQKQFKNWEELNLSTWKAMIELYKAGKIRAIGVSNFLPKHLKTLLNSEISPMVNQIEIHPAYKQDETVNFCKENQIAVEAWSPLGSGRLLEQENLKKLAQKYQKSTAQICIRWALQKGIIPLPKTITRERIKENSLVFDFEISPEDMQELNNLKTYGYSGLHPDEVNF